MLYLGESGGQEASWGLCLEKLGEAGGLRVGSAQHAVALSFLHLSGSSPGGMRRLGFPDLV